MAMLRPFLIAMVLALSACAPSAPTVPDMQFALADQGKYKTDADRDRALLTAKLDCKTKALAASANIEKSIAGERHSMENLSRAREQAAEMYAASFALCMTNAGYVQKS